MRFFLPPSVYFCKGRATDANQDNFFHFSQNTVRFAKMKISFYRYLKYFSFLSSFFPKFFFKLLSAQAWVNLRRFLEMGSGRCIILSMKPGRQQEFDWMMFHKSSSSDKHRHVLASKSGRGHSRHTLGYTPVEFSKERGKKLVKMLQSSTPHDSALWREKNKIETFHF